MRGYVIPACAACVAPGDPLVGSLVRASEMDWQCCWQGGLPSRIFVRQHQHSPDPKQAGGPQPHSHTRLRLAIHAVDRPPHP